MATVEPLTTASVQAVTDEPHTSAAPIDATALPADPQPGQQAATSQADSSTEMPVDLDAIERDLTAVEAALGRLADGTYYTDEITGAPLPDDLLAADPTARRA